MNSKIKVKLLFQELEVSKECLEDFNFNEFDKFFNESDYRITMLAYALVIIFLGTTLFGIFMTLLFNSYGHTHYLNVTSNFFIAMLFGEIIAMLACILFVCLYSSFVDVYSSFFSNSFKLHFKSIEENEKLKTI
jgi:flagellar biosynthesis protein FlhB